MTDSLRNALFLFLCFVCPGPMGDTAPLAADDSPSTTTAVSEVDPLFSETTPSENAPTAHAADSAIESETTGATPTSSSMTELSDYWVVSTRRAVQTIHEKNRGPWHLDVYHCTSDGQSESCQLADLSSGIVPGVPVCIFAHGSFVSWQSHCQQACRATQQIRRAIGDQPLQLIHFSWPSDGPYTYVPTVDVSVRGKRAEFNGFHLATLISQLPESCPVTVIGHSHGTRVALAAMTLAAGGTIQDHTFTGSVGANRRMRVVLAAGAIDHHWLRPDQRYGPAMNRIECLLNLVNQNDLPLALYPLHRPFAKAAIARSGMTSRDVDTLGYNAAKVRQVDVTNRLGSDHLWPDYYEDPVIIATIVPYLVSF